MKEEKKYTYRLDIAYDGELYSGWQIQPNAISIQELLEQKCTLLLKTHHRIVGSGRTDAGVHAIQQVAHLKTDILLDIDSTIRSLNGLLPTDIRVTRISLVSNSFHAQRSAIGKEYHYQIVVGPYILPFDKKYAWYIRHPLPLDPALLHAAASQFEGTHDFFSYANENAQGAAAKNSIRTIYSIRVIEEPQLPHVASQKLRLEFYGNGFLYKMVRNITGMIIAIAMGKRELGEIQDSFTRRDRKAVDKAAPPHGLTLTRVLYPE